MRIFWIMLMAISFLFGAIPQNVINKVKENPAILDTPQGKAILVQYGLTKKEALALISKESKKGPAVLSETVKEKVIEGQNELEKAQKSKAEEKKL